MKKKISGLLSISMAIALIFSLTGCKGAQNNNTGSSKQLEVNIWTHYDAGSDAANWALLSKAFTAKTGVKMNTTAAPQDGNEFNQKQKTMWASGDSSFDVTEFSSTLTNTYASAGYIAPVDTMVPSDRLSDFQITDDNKYNGKLYSLPITSEAVLFFVNTDLFKAANLTPPTTLKDFISDAEKLTQNGVYGTGAYWSKDFIGVDLPHLLLQFKADIYDWTNPNNRAMLQFMYDEIYTYKIMPPTVLADNMDALNQKFIDGKYAMVYQYPYLSAGLGDKFMKSATVAPMPTYNTNQTISDSWSVGVNAKAVNKDGAAALVTYLASTEGQTFYTTFSTSLSCGSQSVMSDPKEDAKMPILGFLSSYAKAGSDGTIKTDPKDSVASNARNNAISRYLSKQINLDECIKECQKGVTDMKNS